MRGLAWRVIFLSTSVLLLTRALAQEPAGPRVGDGSQGWSDARRAGWYSLNQGSRLMPASWMRALEQPGNAEPFLAPDHIAGFGYLPDWPGAPAGHLPLGFAEDDRGDKHLVRTRLRWYAGQRDRERWIGLTCAACHTAEIAFEGRRLRIDGAPAMADFQSFVEAIDQALVATRDDPAKFDRFARGVLAAADTPANRGLLRGALGRLIADQQQLARMNASPIRYGPARLDAFGHIFNKAAILNGAANPVGNPASAPVSYPFLWNVPQHDLVQWNGSVANQRLRLGWGRIDVGAIARNAGEVVGVFGDVAVQPRGSDNLRQFRSSINVNNLAVAEERYLRTLLPPAWPEELRAIDRPAAIRGAVLFQEQCSGCHAPLGRDDLETPIRAQMSRFAYNAPPPGPGRVNIPPGTDPLMACNAFNYRAASGLLQGYGVGNRVIGAEDSGTAFLTVIVRNALIGDWRQVLSLAFTIFLGREPELEPQLEAVPAVPEPSAAYPGLPEVYRLCVDTGWRGPGDRILGYKARPLSGIWATAPFLHNGSVPTLYDLLLPPAERPASFRVGSRRFDPERVGFVTAPSAENRFEFRTRDAQGNVIWGNFNGGHDYNNAALSRRQRLDLVEYMKTL
jgi:cytochrome c peroxidase